jgi:hypothetical protein
MAGKLKSYELLTTSYFPVRPVFPVVFFFLKLTFRAFFVPLPTLGFIENKGLLTGAKSAPVGSSRKRC